MATRWERDRSMSDRQRDSRTPSATLVGDCELVFASALVFKMLHWDVHVVSEPAHHPTVWRKLGVFGSDGAVTVETKPGDGALNPDVLVYCGTERDGTNSVEGPDTTRIELLGIRYDDGMESWQSCSELIAYMRSGLASITRRRDDGA